jgi:RHS repeat-associated protein
MLLAPYALSCSTLVWVDLFTPNVTGSVDDAITISTPKCSPVTETPNGTLNRGSGGLTVNTSGTYSVASGSEGPGIFTVSGCGSTVTIPAAVFVSPDVNTTKWPQLTLPATVQSLSTAPVTFNALNNETSATVPWTISFSLDPVIDDSDDPCKQAGHSTIGCQNQSLAEEVAITGTGIALHYESNRMPGSATGGSPAGAVAVINGGWTPNINHVYDPLVQKLYLGDGSQRSRWQIGNPVTVNPGTITVAQINSGGTGYKLNDIVTVVQSGASGGTLKVTSVRSGSITGLTTQTTGTGYSTANAVATTGGTGTGATVNIGTGNYLITSDDGSEVYMFTASGVHIKTVRPLTGALKYGFGYDSAGHLISISDAAGNVITIHRSSSGLPVSIVSPFGQVTTLTANAGGFLSSVKDPAGHTQTFGYSSSGLMTSRKDANGNSFSYTYDASGRLTKDADSAGGFTKLVRSKSLVAGTLTDTITETTAAGQTSTFQTTRRVSWTDNGKSYNEQRVNAWPNGLQATESKSLQNGSISDKKTLPDGSSYTSTIGPDPRWGLQDPITTAETIKLGSLSMAVANTRTATLATPANPFSLTTQNDTRTLNGRQYTSQFTASTRTWVATTPALRKTTTALDSLERISSMQIGSLLPVTLAYDSHGRLSTVTQGTRSATMTYDGNGFLASVTDASLLKTTFANDADGRLLTLTLPDGRAINYSYDANGNILSIIPPGKTSHAFTYTAINLPSSYTPPPLSGNVVTKYAYDLDGKLTTVTRPDGLIITYSYDGAGRLSSLKTPTETVGYGYNTEGNLSTATISGRGQAIAYTYNGPLLTSAKWSGAIAGAVSRTFDDNFWVASASINGGNTVNYTHDKDGLVTAAGLLTVNHNVNGLLTTTALGSVTDSRSYDEFGELIGYSAQSQIGTNITKLYALTFTRDPDGRIATKTETIGGTTTNYSYTYEAAGRLTKVTKNGLTIATYRYDTNSNRLSVTTGVGTVSGTYDAQDRLLTYGNTAFTYTANGELASATAGGKSTLYHHDILGNLVGVTLPDGTAISYTIDPQNRRVGKQLKGVPAGGFLYDGNHIVAQLDSVNAIFIQFVYATSDTPDYMVKGGVIYRLLCDQLGSPRLVVNSSTGVVVERIDYDEFGNVVNDTNPGFQPFGFAGGLRDLDTNLVRFGARDYMPSVGRWTTKDPILFSGGDSNLYGYVISDPVNRSDRLGLQDDCTTCAKQPPQKNGPFDFGKDSISPPKSGPFDRLSNATVKLGPLTIDKDGLHWSKVTVTPKTDVNNWPNKPNDPHCGPQTPNPNNTPSPDDPNTPFLPPNNQPPNDPNTPNAPGATVQINWGT